MKKNKINILDVLKTKKLEWDRFNNIPFLGAFFEDYYIYLGKLLRKDKPFIIVEYDNLETGENSEYRNRFNSDSEEYAVLLELYESEFYKSRNLALTPS